MTRFVVTRAAARAAAAVLLSLLAGACGDSRAPRSAAVPVTVARVERRDLPYEVTATGTVEPMQTVAVASQVGGILTRVLFTEGDEVRAGQPLFQIDPRPYQAALDQARSLLARDSAQLASAQQDVERYSALVKQDYITPQQYDQAKASAASLRATVDADRAAIENARLNLQFTTIRSPISGRAGALLVRQGNLVRANGQTLVVVNQIRPILVRFAVPAGDLPRIRQYASDSLPVHAQPTGNGGTPAAGTFSFLDNAVDTTTGTILLKGRFTNAEAELWPGEFVNVALELYVQHGAIVVPSAAVVQSQQGDYVFTIGSDNTATMQRVQVDRTAGDLTVVARGLTAGETVVTDGQLRLTTGTKVQIRAATGSDQAGTS
jgi:multidrug efflux system membrane fusion protein